MCKEELRKCTCRKKAYFLETNIVQTVWKK